MRLSLLIFVFLFAGCNSPRDNMTTEEILSLQQKKAEQAGELEQEENFESYTFSKFGIQAVPRWQEGPFSEPVNSKLQVTLRSSDGELISLDPDLYELGFNAFMPSMGHYLDDPGYFVEISEGVYENPAIKFNMANDWRMDLMILDLDYEIVDVVQWLEIL